MRRILGLATTALVVAATLSAQRPMQAPLPFEGWYNTLVRRCVQVAHSCQIQRTLFEDIQWFTTDAPFPCVTAPRRACTLSVWVHTSRIVLDAAHITDRRLVQHAMLHLILGTAEHPSEFVLLNLMGTAE